MRRPARWSGGRSLYSVIMRQTLRLQAVVILVGLALPPLSVIPLELQRRIIDEAIPAGDMARLATLAGLLLAAVGIRSAAKFAVIWARFWIAEIVGRVLRAALVDAHRRRAAPERRKSLGAATSVLTSEVEPLGGFAAEALNTPLIHGGTLLGVLGFMAYTEPALAAVGVAALVTEAVITPILQAWINLLTYRRIRTLRRASRDLIEASEPEHMNGHMIASLHEIRLSYRLRMRMNALKALFKVARNLIDHLAELAVLAIGAVMVMDGSTELGVIVAFLSGLRQLRDPWSELVGFYRRWVDARVKYKLVFGIIDRQTPLRLPEASRRTHPARPPSAG